MDQAFRQIKLHLGLVRESLKRLWAATSEKRYIKFQISASKWTRKQQEYQRTICETLQQLYRYVPDRSSRILDAGCGDGWTLDQLRRDGYIHIEGVDINPEKIRVAAAEYGHVIHRQNLHKLSLPDETYDAVYCRHTLEHVLHADRGLAEFFRILCPGGILFLVVPETRRRGAHFQEFLHLDQVVALVSKVGFQILGSSRRQMLEAEFWVVAKKPAG